MKYFFMFVIMTFGLAACASGNRPPKPVNQLPSNTPAPAFTFPPTWTPVPDIPLSITPAPTRSATATSKAELEATSTEFPYELFASEIATRMASRSSPTPMAACSAIASVPGIPLRDSPFGNNMSGTMSTGQAYEITAWHPPLLYLSLDEIPRGWVSIPRPGLSLQGDDCNRDGPADLEHFFGYPNVCLFLALGGNEPPVLYQEPSLASNFSFNIIIGYYITQVGDFYYVTLSEAGPSGYVHTKSGQLLGDCPKEPE